jgi:hypothetical protein
VYVTEVEMMSVASGRQEMTAMGPVGQLALAIHKTRIARALRAMRDCWDRFDIDGALHAEQRMNEELDLLGHRFREHPTGR